jgi:hypothetical protein
LKEGIGDAADIVFGGVVGSDESLEMPDEKGDGLVKRSVESQGERKGTKESAPCGSCLLQRA